MVFTPPALGVMWVSSHLEGRRLRLCWGCPVCRQDGIRCHDFSHRRGRDGRRVRTCCPPCPLPSFPLHEEHLFTPLPPSLLKNTCIARSPLSVFAFLSRCFFALKRRFCVLKATSVSTGASMSFGTCSFWGDAIVEVVSGRARRRMLRRLDGSDVVLRLRCALFALTQAPSGTK